MYVLKFALQMEKIGRVYFEKLAGETSVTGIRNIFRMLADEQQELYETFAAMERDGDRLSEVDAEALDGARIALSRIFTEDGPAVRALKSDLDAYRHAVGIQKSIVDFFTHRAAKEENGEAKALLMKIVEQEEKLYHEIEDLYEFTAAPRWHPTAIEYNMALDKQR